MLRRACVLIDMVHFRQPSCFPDLLLATVVFLDDCRGIVIQDLSELPWGVSSGSGEHMRPGLSPFRLSTREARIWEMPEVTRVTEEIVNFDLYRFLG